LAVDLRAATSSPHGHGKVASRRDYVDSREIAVKVGSHRARTNGEYYDMSSVRRQLGY
jgi:uncharacterized membrane protein